MYGGPISVDEAWTLRDLVAAGWSEEDLEWERLSERALSELAEGRDGEAFTAIRHALYLARTHFTKGDPRLAASLTSQAAALAAAVPGTAIDVIVRAAAQAWSECDGVIAAMTAPRRARSSMFHLRMERLHRATYEERWREEGRKVLAGLRAGLAATQTPVLIAREEARERVTRWRRDRPAGLDDQRKLLAAVILIAARTDEAHPATKENAGPL